MKYLFLRGTGLFILILSFPICMLAQQTFTGHVFNDSDQKPVVGASVVIKGNKNGTSTGTDGAFSVHAKEGDVLLITGIGISPKQVTVGSESEITIGVTTSARSLNEVVVTATGIKKDAKRIGYAIQTVQASALTQAREANPMDALKGNAAGLTININQEIGHMPDVIMRGEADPNNTPMYVVDGVPINSDTYNLNMDDIETFTILKGPSAAALYGFRGKNGAIIISTKKGTKNKRGYSIVFNSTTQFNNGFLALPKYQDTYGPGDNGTYAFGGGGGGPQTGPGGGGVGVNDYDYDIWGPKFSGQLLPQYDGVYSPTQSYTTNFPNGTSFTGHIAPTPWIARGVNNLTNFIQTGLLSSNSISVASSTDKTDLRFSLRIYIRKEYSRIHSLILQIFQEV
jgi:TonB-dependent SusC/RagA subfamily outer membrane receptor